MHELITRLPHELFARLDGPLHLRFILQPTVAAFLAIRDGYKDAVHGRKPYVWKILRHPGERGEGLKEGLKAVSRVILLGAAMDVVYQVLEIGAFRPLQLGLVVLLLAFVPYLLVRGPALRLTRWWRNRSDRALHASNDG